ncbi:hypothetical protein Q7C_2047 [Methylophaga frappieri]|uniref:Motility protein n=1 Tax=Methylophaga frappieri (strain ATCC BAA-2434 / DSM 25690 / JAM7) TaxID=754477 RepID=I1YJU3_METFJ|nr:hypothetical protein [Methylophaga frappieri]AFJ03186.1 hypothetical protein Q7C_2047 [Methylophaga frappieri]
MESAAIIGLASQLSAVQQVSEQQIAILKLANEQSKANGAAIIALLEQMPVATTKAGQLINIKV